MFYYIPNYIPNYLIPEVYYAKVPDDLIENVKFKHLPTALFHNILELHICKDLDENETLDLSIFPNLFTIYVNYSCHGRLVLPAKICYISTMKHTDIQENRHTIWHPALSMGDIYSNIITRINDYSVVIR